MYHSISTFYFVRALQTKCSSSMVPVGIQPFSLSLFMIRFLKWVVFGLNTRFRDIIWKKKIRAAFKSGFEPLISPRVDPGFIGGRNRIRQYKSVSATIIFTARIKGLLQI